MEHMTGLEEIDTWGYTCRMTDTGMEYSDFQMEIYTMDNGNKVTNMAMDITGGLMEMNILDSLRMIKCTERESNNLMDIYLK